MSWSITAKSLAAATLQSVSGLRTYAGSRKVVRIGEETLFIRMGLGAFIVTGSRRRW